LHSIVIHQGHLSVFQGRETVPASENRLVLHPLVDSQWFDPEVEILDEDGRREFGQDRASGVDGIEQTKGMKKAVASVPFGMVNSAVWRPHIPQGKWELLGYFNELPDESSSRLRCEANEEFVPVLKATDNRGGLKL
jgi:hypothetical protein